MKKTFIATSLLTLLASVTFAWDTTTANGEGYSYDTNGVYTDSRGFIWFMDKNSESIKTFDGIDYSNKEFKADATQKYENGYPVIGRHIGGVLTLYNAEVKNSNFSNSKFISNTNNLQPYAMYVSSVSTLENVNFTDSTFSYTSSAGNNGVTASIRFDGTVKGANFTKVNISYSGEYAPAIQINGNCEDLNLNSATISTGETQIIDIEKGVLKGGIAIQIGNKIIPTGNINVKNLNLNNAIIDATGGIQIYADKNNNISIERISLQNTEFKNIMMKEAVIIGDNNNSYQKLSNIDARGATVNVLGSEAKESFSIEHISYLNSATNLILGDGTIYSFDNGDKSKNLGLVLAEGETFKISKYEPKDGATTFALADSGISAKLTTNSTIKGGTIIFDEGETLNIEENVTLTVSGNSVIDNGVINFAKGSSIVLEDGSKLILSETEFILSDEVDASSILTAGKDSTIVMAGYSNEEAESAFASMFKDSDGEIIKDLDLSLFENFNITGGAAVPEPSTYAAIFGALALGFAIYRRRK